MSNATPSLSSCPATFLAMSACASSPWAVNQGSMIFKQTLVLERVPCSLGKEIAPAAVAHPPIDHAQIGVGPCQEGTQTADLLRPAKRIEIILERQHRRRVDGLTLEDPVDQF